ncbi:sulfotransferase domain-containing protein [Nocardioides sp. S-58]|uniref:Sulfotransferase domain-containing protein n=1 Tax=Nocardioides renjunii TaxID=3095075 RepID=A0ABU5K5M6_9ACTN|nr:sulfotransferase domain-containing protein [Nocardioides sp. S-58]MDZ5660243.1 sulfotransferase domain-containing protein [Nocardioides sp. S-58]
MSRHLLVAGAQRCGTTYLRRLLADHPGVAMAEPARPEPKVLLDPAQVARGAEWYRATYFPHARDGQLLGEKSTSYLELPEAAAAASRLLGEPLVMVQLRDPVRRAVSHWSFSTEQGMERRPLAEVLEANLAGPLPWDGSGASVSPFAYLERGRYVDHLRPWLAEHGDRVRIQLLEDLVASPATMRETYAWLGIDPDHVPDSWGTPENASHGDTAPPLDPDLHQRLRDHFTEADAELADLLGRELPWRSPTRPPA